MCSVAGRVLKKENYFHKCGFCKVFTASDRMRSGYAWHSHDFMQIWYVLRGRCENYVEERVYCLDVGDSFLVPPNMEHKTLLHPGTSVICCDFALEEVLRQTEQRESACGELDLMSVLYFLQGSKVRLPCFRFQQQSRRRVEGIMSEMLEEYEQGALYYQEVLRIKIRELLLLFMREFATSPGYMEADMVYEKYKALMSEAISYIDGHYCESLTLGEVCKRFAISKTYFCSLFKLITRQTFTEYLTELRLRAAMKLLEERSHSISEISEQLGFSSVSYFSKLFKGYTGCLPKEYRKKHGNMEGTSRD